MSCKLCGSCCSEPGWLKPADWDNIAKRLELTKEEVLSKYLIIDFLGDENGYSFVLAPVKTVEGKPISTPGEKVPWNYAHRIGKCIFLKDNLCSLHPIKPSECLSYECKKARGDSESVAQEAFLDILDPKDYAKELLHTSKRPEIASLWKAYNLEKLIPKKYDKAHCLKNLETEELLLKEYQRDFPDIDLIARLERLLD